MPVLNHLRQAETFAKPLINLIAETIKYSFGCLYRV